MPVLPKVKDEKLAQNLARGTMTLKAACLDAGYTTNPAQVTVKTSQPHIQARVAELRALREKAITNAFEREVQTSAQIAVKIGATKEKIIQALWFNAQRCLRGQPVLDANGVQTGQYTGKPDANGANQALKLIGLECYGMFVEKLEIGGPGDFSRMADEEFQRHLLDEAAALGLPEDAQEALLLTYEPEKNGGTENGGGT